MKAVFDKKYCAAIEAGSRLKSVAACLLTCGNVCFAAEPCGGGGYFFLRNSARIFLGI